MQYKFSEDFKNLKVNCPPKSYKTRNGTVYRWVFEDIKDKRNFTPRFHLVPKTQLQKLENIKDIIERDKKKCSMLALSMFETVTAAKNRFQYFLNMQRKVAYKRLGTHVAQGTITDKDGVNDEPNHLGHFNHHPVQGCEYENRFNIISKL